MAAWQSDLTEWNSGSEKMPDSLSKKDFRALGCEDISGPQLRARVFHLEALVCELGATLEEMLKDLDRHGHVRPIVMDGARETVATMRERFGGKGL